MSGIDRFARKLVETGDLFGAARDSFLQFASDFLREIAQMILKKAIFNALSGAGGGGGVGGFITGILGRLFHSGGVVGSGGGASRRIPALAFAGRPGSIPADCRVWPPTRSPRSSRRRRKS